MTTTRTLTIGLPIPLDVAGPLIAAIGTMWPESTVDHGAYGMRINVPSRYAKRVSKKALRELLPEILDPDRDPEAVLESWNDGTFVISQDSFSEAQQRLAAWALIMLGETKAPNYVEQTVEIAAEEPDGTSRRFHFSVAWSKGQSPHQQLIEARAEIERLKADLEATA